MNKTREELIITDEESIKDKIYIIRGQKVMLDSDLDKIYSYSTKDLNRQVRNNIEKFDSDFMFQLTEEEYQNLRCKSFTSNFKSRTHGGRRNLPYAFTEQGIYMLMTVLRVDLAIKRSKALIRLCKMFTNLLSYVKISLRCNYGVVRW